MPGNGSIGCASNTGSDPDRRRLERLPPLYSGTPNGHSALIRNAFRRSRGTPITYSSILLAILVGIVHAGLAPVLIVGDVKPNFVLVAVILVTTSFGFEAGIAWAFIAGVVANLLIPEPLGSIPLALLAVAALAAGGGRAFGRLVWVYPIAAAFVGSLVADLISLAALSLVAGSGGAGIPVQLLVSAAVLNAAITGLLLIPTRILLQRFGPEERPAW